MASPCEEGEAEKGSWQGMGCGVEVADTGDVFDNLVLKVDIDKIPRGLYKIRFHVYLRSESRQ